MIKPDCPLCEEVLRCQDKAFPLLIHEFEHSYFILGSHQFYQGYSLLILKHHARELHDLAPLVQKGLFNELMQAGKAINAAFLPWKLNYASYGNVVEHIHWHIIPRYLTDSRHKEEPFCNAQEFAKFPTQWESAQQDIKLIQKNIS